MLCSQSMGENVVEIHELRRNFRSKLGTFKRRIKEVTALDGLSFSIRPGEVFGLLGENGAGKTTTIKILTTLLLPTSGEVEVLGYNVIQKPHLVRSRIGFVLGGERGLYWRLSAIDNLRYFANLYLLEPSVARQRIKELLELVGLTERRDEKVQGFSRGMKQRLHIARALLHDPELIFLDEPTIGLDPVGARDTRALVRSLQERGKTLLLTTHYMQEADELCNRIAILDKGKIAALDTPTNLKRCIDQATYIIVETGGEATSSTSGLRQIPGIDYVEIVNEVPQTSLRIQTRNGAASVADVVAQLQRDGLDILNVSVREPTLEDAYIYFVKGDKA